jgi:hypothetical protein
VVDPGRDYPRADVLAGFARDAWAAGRRDDLWTLEPVYFRASAAEERRGPGSPGSLESARGNRTT